jgi:hypothetical protein
VRLARRCKRNPPQVCRATSPFTPIATKFGQCREASLSVHEPTSACLLDHLVGAGEQCGRHGEPNVLSRLEINEQIVLGRRLHRKIGGLLASENAIDVTRGMPHLDRKISGIGNQPAAGDEIGQAIDRWQLVLLGKRNDWLAMNNRQRGSGHDHAAAAAAREGRDAVLGLGEVAHIDREDLHPERGCPGLDDGVLPDRRGLGRVPNDCCPRGAWHDLLEQL